MDKYFELNVDSVIDYVKSKIDFFSSDAEYKCNEIGDGNLNLVFKVYDSKNNKSLIVKQSLPYVRAAGEDWPLDIGRGEIESRILGIEYELTDGLVPEIYIYDPIMCCMVMEDLSDYVIMRYGLIDREIYPKFVDQISDFMVKTLLLTSDVVMEHKEKKESVKSFINPELCEITEDLVFTEPFNTGARNNVEESLVEFHIANIVNDEKLSLEAAKLKFDFMNNAQALIHGDLHTGSIFVNKDSTKVIDPEFAFYGPMAYDIGNVIANLIMNYLSAFYSMADGDKKDNFCRYMLSTIKDTVDVTKAKFLSVWDDVVTDAMAKKKGFKEHYIEDVFVNTAGVCGCEMTRRTVGFAQVKDLNSIEDDTARYKAKTTNLLIAKELIINRTTAVTGQDYLDLLSKYCK
ncbi:MULTISPECIES: S-methyl-5-thioribose kinase [unclassified Oceanispirochaeta]|uniref:S-methyl-5-thioribose kinase n=1 Tax=unclassified Oceanispirochaeta TaxID=2635722 RepID=UPI000E09875A|nr:MULTISPECIES: S-methyl-5-thioribose kinase [unclassified Oceanispirochaeta]MBF9017960.1 S-methyl-5-thioribose kinase [Oceanispirochaeta sp. M2]NPD74471.1 S-methyl-5-thioribose kinase [Oceanispirochaeta sp. M1]RDG29679.1 S-methyl-5-thioribose kinase [Oceanispirochaeta sp. M1]